MIRRYCLMLAAAMAVSFASAVGAQSFPAKPIKLVVPFAPGGSTDLVARMLAERMGPLLGQSVTVDNRGGAGGTLGADLVAKATPDGYTLLMGTVSTHGASPAIYRKIPYDPVKDFQPITNVMSVPSVFVVNPKMPAKSMRDFIAMAKTAPGRHTFASPGIGSLGHANLENFADLAGIQPLHVPYKGVARLAQMGHPAQNRHSLQIEIRRPRYVHEATRERAPGFEVLRAHLTEVLGEIANYVRSRLPN